MLVVKKEIKKTRVKKEIKKTRENFHPIFENFLKEKISVPSSFSFYKIKEYSF